MRAALVSEGKVYGTLPVLTGPLREARYRMAVFIDSLRVYGSGDPCGTIAEPGGVSGRRGRKSLRQLTVVYGNLTGRKLRNARIHCPLTDLRVPRPPWYYRSTLPRSNAHTIFLCVHHGVLERRRPRWLPSSDAFLTGA